MQTTNSPTASNISSIKSDHQFTPSSWHSTFSFLLPVLATSYYIASSVSLTIFNKILFSRYEAVHTPFLLLCQSITAVVVLLTLRLFNKFSLPPISTWSWSSIRFYLPLYIANITMLLTAMFALKLTSLLMYNTLRRASMVFVVAIYSLLNRSRPPLYTLAATMLVTSGAVFASSTDLAFDPLGYSLAFVANLSTAIYLVLVVPVRDKLKISNIQLVFVNALANIPILVVITLIWPPRNGFLMQFNDVQFSLLFLCSCILAMLINHSTFVNTTVNDAIAQSVASQLKDVVLLIVSVVFIDDPSSRAKGNLRGVMIGFFGSLVYGIGKVNDRLRNSTAEIPVAQKKSVQISTAAVSEKEGDESSDDEDDTRVDIPLVDANSSHQTSEQETNHNERSSPRT